MGYFRSRKIIKENGFPRCHYTRKGHNWKSKISYNSKEQAKAALSKLHNKNYCVYKCSVCNKWHIGFKK